MLEAGDFSSYYNISQKKLVERSERVHEAGIRKTGLSGRICEFLLKEFLRVEVPLLNFNTGVIILEETGLPRPKEFKISPQIDVIVYKEQPSFSIANVCSINKRQVVACIEVKKWTSPSDITNPEKYNRQISKIKTITGKPLHFISYRHYHRKLPLTELKRQCLADYTYVFSKENKAPLYPWEDNEVWLYPGELEKLVRDLETYIV